MSSSITPKTCLDARVDVAGHRDVDDEQRATVTAAHDLFHVGALEQRAGRAGGREQHVAGHERVEHVVERDRATADTGRELAAPGAAAVRDDDLLDAGTGERERHPFADVAGAEEQHPATFERSESLARDLDRGRRHRHRVAADARLGPRPLADLDRVAERAGQELADRPLALGRAARPRGPGRGSRPRR